MSHTAPPTSEHASHAPTVTTRAQHLQYLHHTISLATASPCLPTNFRVGCVLVSYPISSSSTPSSPRILSTGYTLELSGNTHAEQCALSKLALAHSLPNADTVPDLSTILTLEANVTLYTSLEPCGKRLSGNLPCVQRIVATRKDSSTGDRAGGIRKVIFGAKEPGTFVTDSQSCRLLTEAGIEWEYIPDLEQEILKVAMEGHTKTATLDDGKANTNTVDTTGSAAVKNSRQSSDQAPASTSGQDVKETWHPDVSEEERQARESAPRNPKKRMMEV